VPGSRSLPAAGSAWPGARGARALARQAGRRCARSPKPRLDRPTVRAEDASTDGAADAPARDGFRLRRADRSGDCALLEHPRARRTPLRCASRAARCPTPRVLRSAPLSLHCEREPPLANARLAPGLAPGANHGRADARPRPAFCCWATKAAANSATLACWWRGSLLALSKTCRSLPNGPAPRGPASGVPTSSAGKSKGAACPFRSPNNRLPGLTPVVQPSMPIPPPKF
jgi:hypothetical protein